MNLKLFVWENFNPDYSDGLAFAIAENINQAQELVIAKKGHNLSNWGIVKEFPIAPIAFEVSGGG